MKKTYPSRPSSFSILIIFVLLMIVGVSVLPLLNVQLTPSRSLPGLSVSYHWPDASARVIEQEVTSKLEGLFSSVKGIKEVSSKSWGKSILYTCLGNNYKALGKHTEAEQAYLHAFNMPPSRFYPLYLLAKLYNETGQKEKAVAMANKVMGKEVKIKSTAVEEIQEEMRKIIEKQNNTQDMSNPKGKDRKYNLQVATASCPAPFLKKESEVR